MLRLGLLTDGQVGVRKCSQASLGEEMLVQVVGAQGMGVLEEALAPHADLQIQSDNRSAKHPA